MLPAVMGPPAQASDADLPALPWRAAPSAATAAQRAGSGTSSFPKAPDAGPRLREQRADDAGQDVPAAGGGQPRDRRPG